MIIVCCEEISMCEGRKILVCFVCDINISQTMVYVAAFLVTLESFQWIGVNQVGFIVFWPTLNKILNIEQKISLKNKLNQY